MTIHDPVEARLAELRHALQSVSAPPALEGALAARFRSSQRAARPSLWWIPPLALLAAVAIVSWMIRGPVPPMDPALANPAGDVDPTPFLALKPLDRIALEPGTTVVTSEFPRALLADWGLPVSPDRAGEPVRAETLYSADGEALAIRLVN